MTYDPNNPFGGAVAGGLQEGDPYPISGGDYAAPAVPEYNPLLGLNCPMGGVTDENGNCPSGMTPEAEQAELDRQAEEKRLAEEKRIADEKAAADKLAADEAARVAEEQRITEETRLVEEKRVADEEAQKIADQQKQPFAGAEAGALNAQDIYNEYGILPSQTPLPYSSFQHDLPLGIRIGENEYYQAQTPEEFKRMVELAQENQKYLASPTNQIYDPDTRTWSLPLTAPVIRTAKDLEDWVNQSKTFESDFVESLNYWQVQKSRLTRQEEAQTRIAGVKASYNDEAGQPVYEGINAAYAARAKKLPLYPAAEIERSLKQLTDGYTLFVNQKIPDSFKVTPTGTSVGADFRTKPNLKIEFNGVDINDPNIKLTPSQITQAKKEAESNPQMFARLLQQAGGHPITRELVKGMYPDLSNEEVVLLLGKQQGLTTSTGNGIPEKINPNTKYPYEQPPVLALDLLNRWTGFKVGAEAPWADKENDYKRRMADMFSDPTIPNIGKNLLLSIGAGLYEGSIKPIFSVMQSVFSTISVLATETERTQGAGERISFDAYDPPAGIPGVIPNNELTRFLGLTKKELVSTMIGFIPLEALPGAGRSFGKALDKNKLIEGIAVDIADGMSHKQIVNAWGVRAKELDINLGTAIEDAKKLFKQTIKDAMYPPEIKVKQTVPANPGEPVPIKDLSPDGTTKTVEVTARRIDDPSTPVKPESIIEQNGQKYQIVEPKPTEVPATESVAPAGTPTVKGTGALPNGVQNLEQDVLKYNTVDKFVESKINAYHGTGVGILKFTKPTKHTTLGGLRDYGVFVSNEKVATRYANDFYPKSPQVNAVFADIKNPLDLSAIEYNKFQKLVGAVDNKKGLTEYQDIDLEIFFKDHNLGKYSPTIHPVDAIKNAGYDSIRAAAGKGGAEPEILVFDPSKVLTESELRNIYNQVKPTVKSPPSLPSEAGKGLKVEGAVKSPVAGEVPKVVESPQMVESKSKVLKGMNDILLDDYRVPTEYPKMTLVEAKHNAVDAVFSLPDNEARLIAMGAKPVPANTTDIMFKNAYVNKLLAEGKYEEATWAVNSLKNANIGYGQNIVSNRIWVNEHEPLTWVKKLTDAKQASVKMAESPAKVVEAAVQEAKVFINKNKVDLKDVEKFIDDLICK
jgi:hypothetical protein